MPQSQKRRRMYARQNSIRASRGVEPIRSSTRPTVRGRTWQETRDVILALADHLCAWCGAPATTTSPRASGGTDRGSVCWNGAWCGSCDPDIRAVGMGPPSRFASDTPLPPIVHVPRAAPEAALLAFPLHERLLRYLVRMRGPILCGTVSDAFPGTDRREVWRTLRLMAKRGTIAHMPPYTYAAHADDTTAPAHRRG